MDIGVDMLGNNYVETANIVASCIMYILLNTGRKQLLSTLNKTLYVHASEYKHLQTLLFSLYFANIFNMMDFNFLSGKQHC
jgi:hypothetical protein